MEGVKFNEIAEIEMKDVETEIPEFVLNREFQEFAPNMEVQAEEIRDVFVDIPELQYGEWKELGIDQRTEVLNAFEQEIAKIEMRDAMPVEHEATKPSLMGYYNGTKLVISDNLLGDDSYNAYREVMDTLFHEGRHAYQFYNLDVARTEASTEMVEAWRVNIQELGYEKGRNTLLSNAGFYRYYIQPVEVDARLFAETVVNKLGI